MIAPAIACTIGAPAIELSLPLMVAPMVSDLLTTRGLILTTGDARDDKLIFELGAMAHHAGYLSRIYWGLAHCTRGVGVCYPIGHDIHRHPLGQGAGRLPIGQ